MPDSRGHASASTRNSRRASAAQRLSSSGSGSARRSSRKAWKAAGEQSSSGFVTTTAEPGGRSLGRFAMPLSYRPLLPLHSLTVSLPVDSGLPAPTAIETTVVSTGDARISTNATRVPRSDVADVDQLVTVTLGRNLEMVGLWAWCIGDGWGIDGAGRGMCRGTLASMSRPERITIDPVICHGQPSVRGLRYPVENLLELLASGMSIEEIIDDHPDLERDDLLAAREFGALASGRRRVMPSDTA